jgi:hypothetical protein
MTDTEGLRPSVAFLKKQGVGGILDYAAEADLGAAPNPNNPNKWVSMCVCVCVCASTNGYMCVSVMLSPHCVLLSYHTQTHTRTYTHTHTHTHRDKHTLRWEIARLRT